MALLETLKDAYEDGVRDAVWNENSVLTDSASPTGVTVSESGGLLNVSPVNNGAGIHYSGYTSVSTYDLTNSYAQVKATAVTNNVGQAITQFGVGTSNNNKFVWLKDSTSLYAQYMSPGTTTLYTAAWDATTFKYWRIRHGTAMAGSGDTVYWDTSADGLTWTNRASVARPITITALVGETAAGTWQATVGPGTAQFDDFNPPQVTPFLVGHGTAAFTATNAATIAPALPTGWLADDIHILVAARSDNTAMTSLAGWTNIAALTGNNTAAQRVEVWWRRAVAGDAAPTVTFGSGTVVRGAFIIGVRGCPTTIDPFNASSFLANAASATLSFTDVTTTHPNCLILAAGAYEDDPTTITTMTNFVQPGGAVQTSALGNDMMLCYETRTLGAAGAAGASSVTVSGGTFANSVNVGVVLALRPETLAPPPYRHRWRFFRRAA